MLVAFLAGIASLVLLVRQLPQRRAQERERESATVRSAAAPARPARPILWVLAIGVSDYERADLDLRFAAADAQALAEALHRQADGPLYERVETKVLTDRAVSRASILRSLDEFLGQASPIDVGVIYLAGHGARDPLHESYYFLPADASPERPQIEGLDMVELNRQLHLVHRNLRRLVVILDTCHAGKMAGAAAALLGQDLAAGLAPLEGLYILTAAQSGERSVELPGAGHGLFTHALLDGLGGAGANPDGLITVSGLVGHASRVVRHSSNNRQHPYQAIVGDDLALAADVTRFAQITPPPLPTPALVEAQAERQRVAVLRFENLRPDPEQSWMEKALRQEFTTALAGISRLDVYEEPEVRFLARGTADVIEAAQRVGMQKLVSGSYWVEGDRITITAEVKNVAPLQRVASTRIDGRLDDFFALRGKIVLDLLRQLRLELPADELERLRRPDSTNLAARKLLFGAEGEGQESAPSRPVPTPDDRRSGLSLLGPIGFWPFAAPCHAAEADGSDAELRRTLEDYRTAFTREDLEGLAAFYARFTSRQARALQRYFDNAEHLEIEFDDVRIAIIGERASVSFTRRDRFVDRETGERQQVVVRLTKLFVKGSEGWRIVPEE